MYMVLCGIMLPLADIMLVTGSHPGAITKNTQQNFSITDCHIITTASRCHHDIHITFGFSNKQDVMTNNYEYTFIYLLSEQLL